MIQNHSQHEISRRRNASRLGPLRSGAAPSTSELGTQNSELRTRLAFTLIELLVSIAIIAILASIVMVGVGAANESAKKRKTEVLVTVLHELLMERYDSYQTRRVPVKTSGLTPRQAAQKRLEGLRLLMAIEMPERWDEVDMSGTDITGKTGRVVAIPSAEFAGFKNALYHAYARRKIAGLTKENQRAECLYMIITMATGDGEALSHFSDRDIGDVDNDGAKEFLDGWGNPINFLRWPAGFNSELQSGDATTDHDPFDIMNVDSGAYRLLPLIYSSGSDGIADTVATGKDWIPTLDPYEDVTHEGVPVGPRGSFRDEDMDGDNSVDNIHNHLLNRR